MTSGELVDYYRILEIAEDAEQNEIVHALKIQQRSWRKRQNSPTLATRQDAERRMADLADAEKILLDPAARRDFDSRRRSRPPTPTILVDESIDWGERANHSFAQGDMESANHAAQNALTQASSAYAKDHLWNIRAQSALSIGDWREAEFSFIETLRLKPNHPEYHFDYGCALELREQYADAMREFREASTLEPSNPRYGAAIADVHIAIDEVAMALTIMEDIVREHPDDESFQRGLALALLLSSKEKMTTCRVNGEELVYITSIPQADYIKSALTRAMRLKFEEADLRAAIQRELARAESATDLVWYRPKFGVSWEDMFRFKLITVDGKQRQIFYNPIDTGLGWGVIAMVGLGLLSIYGVGVAVLIPAAYIFYKRYKIPAWKADARKVNFFIVSDREHDPEFTYRLGVAHFTKIAM